jgi:hypothetical protein
VVRSWVEKMMAKDEYLEARALHPLKVYADIVAMLEEALPHAQPKHSY